MLFEERTHAKDAVHRRRVGTTTTLKWGNIYASNAHTQPDYLLVV